MIIKAKPGPVPQSADGTAMSSRTFRASDGEWEKCQALGGGAWLREQIRNAPKPPKRKR